MCSTFKAYHYIWLQSHPHRSASWLKEMLVAGFDVHHIDGNHSNNDPENLVLIEHTDHMRLHGCQTLGRLKYIDRKSGPQPLTLERGQRAHELRAKGMKWKEIGIEIGVTMTAAMSAAKRYREHSRP